jgi:hypothetical protein
MPARVGADATEAIDLPIEPFQVTISKETVVPDGSVWFGIRQLSTLQNRNTETASGTDNLNLEKMIVAMNHHPIKLAILQHTSSIGERNAQSPGEVHLPAQEGMIVSFQQRHIPSDRNGEALILAAADALIAKKMDSNRQSRLRSQFSPHGREILDRMSDKNAKSLAHRLYPISPSSVRGSNERALVLAADGTSRKAVSTFYFGAAAARQPIVPEQKSAQKSLIYFLLVFFSISIEVCLVVVTFYDACEFDIEVLAVFRLMIRW